MYQGHFSIRRIENMYLRYFLSWLFSGGRDSFLFSFGCTTPFYCTFHSLRSDPHAFARRGAFLPAFLPASCFPLQPEQTPDGCFAQSRLLNFRSWPSTQGFLARHWLLLPLQCQAGVAGLPTSCRHYGENMPACALRTRPSEARRFVFYFSLLLLAEVTIIFRRKDSMRSGAA